MADQKVSDLPALNGADVDAADLLYIVDSSAGSAGSKKITVGQYQLAPVSGGTANGVAYLNGSKVVTTGSALVFDGTNLGVGTTSPTQRLDVVTTSATVAKFTRDLATDVSLTIGADNDGAILGTDGVNVMRMFTGGTERMRLDASGNIGLNGTSPSAWFGYKALQSDQSSLYEASNSVGLSSNSYFPSAGTSWTRISALATARYDITSGVHKWFADASGAAGGSFTPTERMQLDNSGNLLVGTTTSAARLTVEGSALVAKFRRTSSGGIAQFQNGSDAGFGIDLLNVAGTSAGSIYWTATTTTYATSSDRRLKENVVAAPSASAAIDAIQIVSYDWKAAPNEPRTTYGVIAQDLHTVAPEAVSVGDDGDTVEKPWGVDYSKLVPMLIKEIQSLRARVAALESA